MPNSDRHSGVCPACGFDLSQPAPERDLTVASLFQSTERPQARRSDPSTSRDAARAVWPKVGSQRFAVLIAIRNAGQPLTSEEAGQRAGVKNTSASSRATELVRGRWLEVVGERDGKQLLDLTDAARAKLPVAEAIAA